MAALAESPQNAASQTATLQFVGRLQDIPQVRRVGFTSGPDVLHMWILLDSDDDTAMHEAIDAMREFLLRSGPSPMDFHFIPLDETDPGTLPEMTTVFARR